MNTNITPVVANEFKPAGNVRWKVTVILLLVALINYLDRTNLAIAATQMMKELHLTNTDIGLCGAVFAWTYAIMQLPAGWLVDRFGAKRVMITALVGWSFATLLSGIAHTLAFLLFARFMVGFFESPCMPTLSKIISFWVPKKEKDLATGIWNSGTKFGPALAPPLLVTIMVLFGWRALFYITGIAGILLGAYIWKRYHSPQEDKSLSQEELDYIMADSGVEEKTNQSKISWLSLFRYRSVWGLLLGYFCITWIWTIFINFLPLFLYNTQHISLAQLGFYASIPWIGGITGSIGGGWITQKLMEKANIPPIRAKRIVISVSALITGISVCSIPFVDGLGQTITVLTIAIFCISNMQARSWALSVDVSPRALVASVGSLQNFGGYFGGAFAPVVCGMIVDSTGSYTLAFISGGMIVACAAICYWVIVKEPIPA
ncbi:MAG: MFS transporter [Negativicutes bacterium]|nr:MFS transporter [Negativicutes bacterium]